MMQFAVHILHATEIYPFLGDVPDIAMRLKTTMVAMRDVSEVVGLHDPMLRLDMFHNPARSSGLS